MAELTPRVAIAIAVIGLVGTLGAALIANWDKLFPAGREPLPTREVPRAEPPQPSVNPPRAQPSAPTGAVAPQVPNIAGTWRDTEYPVVGQVIQDGRQFRFVRRGALTNGVGFESSGEGTIDGTQISNRFDTRYQTGAVSTGGCTGTLTADGNRLDLTCTDSLLGTFPVTAVRQ